MRITTTTIHFLLLVSSSTSFSIQQSSRLAALSSTSRSRTIKYEYKHRATLKQSKQDDEEEVLASADPSSPLPTRRRRFFLDDIEKEEDLAVVASSQRNLQMEQVFFGEMEIEQQQGAATTMKQEEGDSQAVWNARLLLLAAAALYGTNFSFVKILGEAMPVGASGTLRFGLAAMAGLPWLLAKPKDNSDMTMTLAAAFAGFEVGLWNSVGYVAQAVGLETTSASKSAFLCSLAVVIVPLIDRVMGKVLTQKQIVGAIMAVFGVAFLELGGGPIEALSSGDIASLVQPFAFGIGFWKMEQAMRAHPDEASRSTAAQLFAIFVTSAAYLVLGNDVVPDMTQVQTWLSDPMILGSIVWTGAITTALTVYMETLALKTLSAADTTLIFSTEPLWGAACSSVVLGETFGGSAVAGGALILAGCLVSNLGWNGIQQLVMKTSDNDDSSSSSSNPFVGYKLLNASGVAAAMGGLMTSLSSSMEMASASELDVIEVFEEVISKTTDVL